MLTNLFLFYVFSFTGGPLRASLSGDSQLASTAIGLAGAKIFGNRELEMSSIGFLFSNVEWGALACIIAMKLLEFVRSAKPCIPFVISCPFKTGYTPA